MKPWHHLVVVISPLVACSTPPGPAAPLPAVPAARAQAPGASAPAMHHHHHSGASSAARQDAEVQARFDFEEVAAHQAMAKEMGIQWTPEPDKNFHFSLSLSRTVDDEPLRELSVVLAVTDPSGRVTKRVADVMSAPGMYHYGIDFRRDLPGAYRAQAWFDLEGRTHAFDASIPLP